MLLTLQVTLKMTPELKQQLFEEKPHIRRAYTALVPQSVNEKDFWQRFFQYEFARKVCEKLFVAASHVRLQLPSAWAAQHGC